MQVAVWLVLLFLSLFGYDWIELSRFKGSETALAVLMLPLVYPLGMFVDEFADWLLTRPRERIRLQCVPNESRRIMDLLMTARDATLTNFFDYIRIRIRMRLSRSSALNFAMIAILFPIFAWTRLQGWAGPSAGSLALAGGLASAAIAVFAYRTWRSVTRSFYSKLAHGLSVVSRLQPPPATLVKP